MIDNVERFVSERCVIEYHAQIRSSILYDEYQRWCFESKVPRVSIKGFHRVLKSLGIFFKRNGEGRLFENVRLKKK